MNDPVSRLSRGGSINKSLRNYLSKRWFEFYFLLHKKMVYYSGEELCSCVIPNILSGGMRISSENF